MIVPIVQGSPAWTLWREHGLGGTDAQAIWAAAEGLRGAKRELEALLGRKLAPAPPDDRYPEHWRPQPLAPALAELARRVGWSLAPACVQHAEEPWLRATLGGLTWAGDALALSTQSTIDRHERFLAGDLSGLPLLLVQAQHAMLASGASLCWFVSSCDRKHFAPAERWAVVEVAEDGEFQAELHRVESEFWRRLQLARSGGKRVRETA